jgi:hypothetical protein
MHSNFEFIEGTSASKPFKKYMETYKSTNTLNTAVIKGNGKKGGSEFVVNYKGKDISGKELKDQLEQWARYGTIEKDAASSMQSLCDGKVDLKGQYYVLIGAGSAMGPYYKLLEHGATVVCVDIPGKWGERPAGMWKRLIEVARNSPGEILIPLSDVEQKQCKTDDELIAAAGCNLMEAPAQILKWLKTIAEDHQLCVGNYTYLDGELHVKLAIAADSIISGLCHARPDTKVAFLCTPTDLHVINDDAYNAAVSNYGWHFGRGIEAFFQLISFGKYLKKNASKPLKTNNANKTLKIVDGLSVAQGPNYALAKRLQHWRAMIAYDQGHVVSSNIAPSTATLSVVSNRTFGWAYGGMPYFKPYEIFQQETTNGVMGAMLIYDTTDKKSASNPKNRKSYEIDNTLELFKHNSVHGGTWRAAYTVDSIGEVSVLIHFLGGPGAFIPMCFLLMGLAYTAFLHYTGAL